MDTLGQELDAALTAVKNEGDCGCGCGGGKKTAAGVDLAAELSAALDAVEAERALGGGDDPFADLSMADSGATLEDILAVAERHPGLKITFSF